MNEEDLMKIVRKGEDSHSQFKSDVANPDSLAAEIVSLLNADGGTIYLGISDNGDISGLDGEDVRRLNLMISNVATQHIKNPVTVLTDNILLSNSKVVIAIKVPEGREKPYFDKNGIAWIKEGADKRKIVSREEIRRCFESSGQVHADEQWTKAEVDRLDKTMFKDFLKRTYNLSVPAKAQDLARVMRNMNLATDDGHLNLAGLLLFGEHPEFLFPQFCVKAVRLNGNSLAAESYDDSEDYAGTLSSIYSGVTAFVARNLHKRQTSAGVNAPGQSEIHPAVVEEVLVNALLHRDYFVDAPIRVLIFDDRMEVVSPGSLPNHLTVEKILAGNTNIRNPILASFVAKGMLPYHGLGSGIMRAKSLCPDIHFEDDKSGVQFKVVIPRGQVAMTTIGRKELVFDALRENPTLPLRSLAKNMNMSLSTIQEYVGALKAEGRLVREGGTRGKWRCVK